WGGAGRPVRTCFAASRLASHLSSLIPPNQQATASVIQSNVESRNWGRVRAIAGFYQPAASPRTAGPLASRRPGRQVDYMAKPLAKLVALITPKRRWAQYSLATMFVVVTALCVWMAVAVNRAHRQRDAVAAIKALGG